MSNVVILITLIPYLSMINVNIVDRRTYFIYYTTLSIMHTIFNIIINYEIMFLAELRCQHIWLKNNDLLHEIVTSRLCAPCFIIIQYYLDYPPHMLRCNRCSCQVKLESDICPFFVLYLMVNNYNVISGKVLM